MFVALRRADTTENIPMHEASGIRKRKRNRKRKRCTKQSKRQPAQLIKKQTIPRFWDCARLCPDFGRFLLYNTTCYPSFTGVCNTPYYIGHVQRPQNYRPKSLRPFGQPLALRTEIRRIQIRKLNGKVYCRTQGEQHFTECAV